MFYQPDRMMINGIDILHKGPRCDFACHTGKDTAELLSIVSYHHNIVVELEGYYYDGLDRPLRVWQPSPATSTATTYYQDTHPYAAGKYASDGSDCSRLFRTFAK